MSLAAMERRRQSAQKLLRRQNQARAVGKGNPLLPSSPFGSNGRSVRSTDARRSTLDSKPQESISYQDGKIILNNAERLYWYRKFGSEEYLDLAIIFLSGRVVPDPRHHSPYTARVRSHLARLVMDKLARNKLGGAGGAPWTQAKYQMPSLGNVLNMAQARKNPPDF